MPADTLVAVLIWLFAAIECIAWDRDDVVYFRTLFWKRWRVVRPSRLLKNTVAGLTFLFPFPPLGAQPRAHFPRVAFSPEGVTACVPESGEPPSPGAEGGPGYSLYEDIRRVEARGDEVLIDGRPFVRAPSKAAAAGLAALVARLKSSRVKDREKIVEDHVAGLFDREGIAAAIENFETRTEWLLMVCSVLWMALIVGMPVFIYLYGFSRAVLPMLGLVLVLHFAATGMTLRAHRKIYGKADYSILYLLLPSPFHSIRATDLLAKKLLAPYHPFAAASVLLEGGRFAAYARQSLALIRHPIYDAARAAGSVKIDQWYKGRLLGQMEAAVKDLGIDLESLGQPEIGDSDDSSRSFCPRCHALYQVETGVCADCPDMALVPVKRNTERGATGG